MEFYVIQFKVGMGTNLNLLYDDFNVQCTHSMQNKLI